MTLYTDDAPVNIYLGKALLVYRSEASLGMWGGIVRVTILKWRSDFPGFIPEPRGHEAQRQNPEEKQPSLQLETALKNLSNP